MNVTKDAEGLCLIQVVLAGQVFNGAKMKGHHLVLLGRVTTEILAVHAHDGGRGEAAKDGVDFIYRCRFARPAGKPLAENSHWPYNQRRPRFL